MMKPGIGDLLRHLRERSGLTRAQQAAVIEEKAGRWFDVDNLKRWERGTRLPIPAWHDLIAEAYGIPVDEVRKAVDVSKRHRRLARLAPMTDIHDMTWEDDSVERRAFLGAALGAGAAAEPWGRLAAALDGARVDQAAVEHLQTSTANLFESEEHIPARMLIARLTAHLDTLTALLPTAGPHRRDLAIAAGETAALTGWTYWDVGDATAAQHYYSVAAHAGREAGHPAVCALALGYGSYAVEPDRASRMLAAAQNLVKGPGYATARSWLCAREAEEAAAMGEQDTAVRALDRANVAFDYAVPDAEQAWVRFFRRSRLGSLTVSAYSRMNHPDLSRTADETLADLGDDDAKIRCAVLGDVASGYLTAGDVERAIEIGRRTLDATLQADSTMGRTRLGDLAGRLPDHTDARALRDQIHAALA